MYLVDLIYGEKKDYFRFVFDGTETEPKVSNFNGVYNYLRFETTADPANTITKILVRN